MANSVVYLIYHSAGTLLVAIVLSLLQQITDQRFLKHWARGWTYLFLSMISLVISQALYEPSLRTMFLSAYCLTQYMFGLSLWVGCRDYVTGQSFRRSDILILTPCLAAGMLWPFIFENYYSIVHSQALLLAGFLALSLVETSKLTHDHAQTSLGVRVLEISLAVQTILFISYYMSYLTTKLYPEMPFPAYMYYSTLYDLLFQTLLGYAMLMIATDRVRRELVSTNQQLHDVSKQLDWAAKTDSLTGVYNRRAWDEHRSNASNDDFSGSLAIVDMNNLKMINDKFGHALGDQAIQMVARVLVQHTRMNDRVYRMGGDEFLVVMRNANAFELEDRLHQVDTILQRTRLGRYEAELEITIAWGATEFNGANQIDLAIRIADKSMYSCKKQRKSLQRSLSTDTIRLDSQFDLTITLPN